MWIQTVHIQGFGRFRDTTFEFEEGLNLVEAPNEAGKTTLVKFIEGMLYGFYKPTKRRQYTEDRDLYEPWDQGSYGGVLIYQEGEQQVRIERCFAKNRDTVHIFDQQTGEEMTQLFAYSESYRQVQPASRDMGLSAATFRNTLLISQDAPHPNGPELAAQVKEYLANAQEGGGDDISVERAVKRLRAKIT
ncbi:MAG: ATP-binding protein, partial [Clostridia bacterium]